MMTGIWEGSITFVTGAASGIGHALSIALLKRGASVWMVDLNAAGVNQAADALGPKATPVVLDVR
ncbi:MAG: SDR family NAD(P)-dependent oxidoreductase, partial [Steroidobacterales bacterium]